ncbi:hypothetical protein D9M69_511980 [compost metagenome]
MLGEVGARHAADQEFGDAAWLQAFDEGAHLTLQAEADAVGGQLAVEDPLQGFLVLHGLFEQVVHLDHIDAALAHLGHEIEVVTLGLADPDHVVEQQFIAVVRSQAQVGQTGGANHDFAQFAGF